MSVKVFITIDTEEDLWNERRIQDNPVDNISRIPIIQDLFDRFGALPTYLINYPVVINEHARRIIRKIYDSGRCEIGAHCHPWNTPPFEEKITGYNTMLCNLPYELQFKKIKTLHKKIIDQIGAVPICFRAGRWGFSSHVARCIHELGYRIDTSVTPFCNWVHEKGPDFSEASAFPYWLDPDDVLSEGSDQYILEVPPTIGFFQKNFERCARVRNWILNSHLSRYRFLGILDKLRLLNFRWLSPELTKASDMILLSKHFLCMGHPYLNLSFHSTSLLPGKGPFVRNEHEFQEFLQKIEIFLQFVIDNRLTFSPLSEALVKANSSK